MTPASFPASVKTWVAVVDSVGGVGGDDILAAHINGAYDEIIAIENAVNGKAAFKIGAGTFALGGTTCVITDAFITTSTLVIVSPTQAKVGSWSVVSSAGSFTITSDATETANVTFDWGGTK